MSQTDAGGPITVYSDYVCPFCYLGRASLREYLDMTAETPAVEWHPFDLRGHKRGPDGEIREDVEDGKDEAYYERVRENVERLKAEYGVEMVSLEATRGVDSWNAQQAALYVRDSYPDRFDAFDDALFEALWTDGRDIGSPDVLAEIATEVGLPREETVDAVHDEQVENRLREAFETARETGITGVPTFVYGRHAARGAVPSAQLRRLVEGV